VDEGLGTDVVGVGVGEGVGVCCVGLPPLSSEEQAASDTAAPPTNSALRLVRTSTLRA